MMDARASDGKIRLSVEPLQITSSNPDMEWLRGKLAAAGWNERRARRRCANGGVGAPFRPLRNPAWLISSTTISKSSRHHRRYRRTRLSPASPRAPFGPENDQAIQDFLVQLEKTLDAAKRIWTS